MVCDAAEHRAQIGFGIEPIQFGGLDERLSRSGAPYPW